LNVRHGPWVALQFHHTIITRRSFTMPATPYDHQKHVDASPALNRHDAVDPNKDPGFAAAVLGAQEQMSAIMQSVHDSTTTPEQAAAKLAEVARLSSQSPLAGK